MKPGMLESAARKNWPGIVSIVLAAASVGAYALSISLPPPDPYGPDKFHPLLTSIYQLGTASSALVGFLAVLRARRGGGGLVTAIIGLILGGALLFLWVAWIGMLIVFNPNMG
jgi:hypothetical protein